MAYLFQSGSARVQLSGGYDINYSDLTTDKRLIIDADGTAIAGAAGSLVLGEGADAAVYFDGTDLELDTASGAKVNFSTAGSRVAFADAAGLTVEAGLGFMVDTNKALDAGTLGATITGSALTVLGTIASLVATTADINAGTVDAVIGGTTPAAGSFTTISGSSTLIVDGSGSFNNGVTFKAGTEITLGVSGDTALDVAADGLYFADATDGFVKTVAIGSFLTDIAGSGLSVVSNQLEAAAVAVTVNGAIGDNASALGVGMNYGTSSFSANRAWTLPALSGLSDGEIVRVKAPINLGGYALEVTPNAADKIDDLADGVSIDIWSENGSVSLMRVDATQWKIF